MKKMIRNFLLFLLCSGTLVLQAAAPHTRIRAGVMPKGPDIDGNITDKEWQGAVPFFGFKRYNSEALSYRQGIFRIGYTGKNLFFACRSELPPQGMKLRSKIARNGKKIYKDDTVELLFHTPKSDYVFQLAVNPRGKIFSAKYKITDGATTHTKILDWHVVPLIASKMHNGYWDLEVKIPLKYANIPANTLPFGRWGFQCGRNFFNPAETTSLTKTQMFCFPQNMAEFIAEYGSPSAGLLTLGKEYKSCKYDIQLPVFNTGNTPRKIECTLNITSGAAPRFLNKTVEIQPGKNHIFNLKFNEPADSVGVYDLKTRIRDVASGKILFERPFSWRQVPKNIWDSGTPQESEFEFAHYPTYGKMKARYGNPQIKADPAVTQVEFLIRNKGGKIISTVKAEKKSYGFYALWDIGRLPDGKYTLEALLTYKTGKTAKKSSTFECKHFPWENNKIGMDRVIIPPFKPLQVKNRDVKALQTGYRIKNGFFDAVYAQGKNILASPVILNINGKKDYLHEKSFRFTERSQDRVIAETVLTGKNIEVKAVHEFDYDGMCKTTLRFIPAGPWKVNTMVLEVPLLDQEVTQMHGMQGIPHFHPSRFVKRHTRGQIWNNLQERQNPRFLTPFWPYLWFGGQYRGLAWFAPSDKNWSLAKDQYSTELVRENNAVTLKVHIVNKMTVKEKPFELVMGFMPSPVKPRPADWRQYTNRWKPAPHAKYIANLSGSYIWGTWRPSDPFPVNHDYEMVRKLAKDIRRKSARERSDIESFIKRNCGNMQLDEIRRLRLHLERGRDFSRNASYLYPYMNPRSGADAWPEFRVFQDEWHHAEYRNPVDYDEYSMYSTPSYSDFLLYYAKKLIDGGLDGIYWDNCGGPLLIFDPVTGPAYELPDGRIQPYCDIFEMRKTIKRTAVMCYLAGKTIFDNRPLVELHITNGITLPYLSFASFQLDLERGFGPDEFHNRFSEEYILTETLGTHTGCAPSVLCCITGNNLDYVTRTFLCYTFAYDLPNVTWQYMGGKDYNKLWRKLYQFGYATKDVEVLTFWENVPHPVTVKDKDTRITVYRKKSNSHTIAAVCDLGNSRRKIEVDISGLNYKNVQVSNWETGKKYSVSPRGTIILDLPRRDFILLEICGK